MQPTSPSSSSFQLEIPEATGWHPLKIYCYYRMMISIILFSAFFAGIENVSLGAYSENLFFYSSSSYALVNLLTLILVNVSRHQNQGMAFLIVVVDIMFITLMAHSSGGIISNLSILMVVTVAAGSILIVGQAATLIAAIATIAVLYEQFHFSFILQQSNDTNQIMQAGLLGITFFGTSILSQQLSTRLRESEQLASQRESELADMQQLNHYIIQRMRTGIVVVDDKRRIRMMNEGAWRMFGMPTRSRQQSLSRVSPELDQQLKGWQLNPAARRKAFRASTNGPEISSNFTQLTAGQSDDILIFLDDTSQMAQQAQQLKLASLGRLTAGIAHEIRNPLGAISHAAQLLGESPDLVPSDSRLAEIIQQHSVRMNTIIENVLQLSRRQPPKPELLTLKEWLTQFVEEYKMYAAGEPDIQLSISPEDIEIRVDATQLTQILTNLFDNGLRYSKEESGVSSLMVNAGISDGSQLPFLEIIDKGPGIEPDKAESIFEPFFTTSSKGTGLGLYISRELCEANQARLDYTPIPTGGSCFRITFAHPDKALAI